MTSAAVTVAPPIPSTLFSQLTKVEVFFLGMHSLTNQLFVT